MLASHSYDRIEIQSNYSANNRVRGRLGEERRAQSLFRLPIRPTERNGRESS